MKTESIIFDMDGTLWDSAANVAASWNDILKTAPDIDLTLTADDIKSIMGLTMDAIADKFFSSLPQERRLQLMDQCGSHENDYLRVHGGTLFDDLEKTLSVLSAHHRLFIVSNCQSGYIEAFLEYNNFGKYITDHLCWGDNQLPKSENIRLIMTKNNITDGVYVGDTQGDCNSAYSAGTRFIYAAYGFGTADRYDCAINSISELINIIE
ncbi:MAG: HAD family hydrolase [Oscillospiraceae bacterium]|nr:HAD family hydrolase [Oscillospiraceae bacterium]